MPPRRLRPGEATTVMPVWGAVIGRVRLPGGGEMCIVPSQHTTESKPTGEKRFALAFLETAIGDLSPTRPKRFQRSAIEFFTESENAEWWPYAFVNLCTLLALEPSWIRRGLRARGLLPEESVEPVAEVVSCGGTLEGLTVSYAC